MSNKGEIVLSDKPKRVRKAKTIAGRAAKGQLPAYDGQYDPKVGKSIVEAVREGMPYTLAGHLHRVPQSTVATWLQKGEDDPSCSTGDFALDLRQAQAEFVQEAVKGIADAGFKDARQWTALMTLLERLYPDHFKRPSERGDTNINIGIRLEERLHALHSEGVIEYTGG